MDEKLKLILSKLLSTYGVEDEAVKNEFIKDIEAELKGTNEEETTEVKEKEEVVKEPALDGKEEETVKVEEETETTDETELPPQEGEMKEESANEKTNVLETKLHEYEETIKALAGRLDHLEQIVSKLGKPVGDEKEVGFDTEKKETTQEEEITDRERVYRHAFGM